MKNLFSKLLILGIVSNSLFFFSCKKDDVTEKNMFTYSSKNYSINFGDQSNYGVTAHTPKATYEFTIMLGSSGITFDNSTNEYAGKGNFIELTMYSLESDNLTPGQYTFDRFSSQDSLTIDGAAVGINYDLISLTDTTGLIYDINKGVVQVEKRGNLYTLDFNLYTEENKQVKGFYSGSLEIKPPALK